MMKNIIFCEGTTDILLLQFVLQYRYEWKYDGFIENALTNRLKMRRLVKDNDFVELHSCGGIMNISHEVSKVKEKMEYATRISEVYDRIIIMIDHDTVSSNKDFVEHLNEKLNSNFTESQMNRYFDWNIKNPILGDVTAQMLIKCIPENDTGAIENILLKALETDNVEKKLVSDCSHFINNVVNSQHRYLQKKSRISKAIFNTYFAIRTPEEKYDERAKVLDAYNWKENNVLDSSFGFLNFNLMQL